MSRDVRYCPRCGTRFNWYEETCDECGADLVDRRPGGDPVPEAPLVAVIQTAEAGLIDLARIALEQAGISYVVQPTAGSPRRKVDERLGGWTSDQPDPAAVVVLESDADRARELLAGLQHDAGAMPAGATTAPANGVSRPTGIAAILLLDAERGTFIGRISEAQFHILVEHLEQESDHDRSYYIDAPTIDMLADAGADETLVNLLKGALAGREGVEVRWSDGC